MLKAFRRTTVQPTIAVKPSDPKLTVRNPDRGFRPLRIDGERVPRSDFWLRRIAQKDVTEIPAETFAAQEQARQDKAVEAEAAAEKAAAEKAAAEKTEAAKVGTGEAEAAAPAA